jgi:hypothetical protein
LLTATPPLYFSTVVRGDNSAGPVSGRNGIYP